MRINNILIALSGISIICLIIWNRLIRVRVAIMLEDINYTYIRFIITICIIISFLFLLIYTIRKVFNIKPKHNSFVIRSLEYLSNTLLISYITTIVKEIIDSPKYIYVLLRDSLSDTYFLTLSASYLGVWLYKFKKLEMFSFSLYLLPKLIVSLVFLIDVIYYHQLNYFYKSILLLLLPIIYKVYFFTVNNITENNLSFLHLHLDYIKHTNGLIQITFKEKAPEIEGAWDFSIVSLEYAKNCVDICVKLKSFFDNLIEIEELYKPYVTIFTSICYIIGWTTYLCIIWYGDIDLSWTSTIIDNIEPFSGISINEYG